MRKFSLAALGVFLFVASALFSIQGKALAEDANLLIAGSQKNFDISIPRDELARRGIQFNASGFEEIEMHLSSRNNSPIKATICLEDSLETENISNRLSLLRNSSGINEADFIVSQYNQCGEIVSNNSGEADIRIQASLLGESILSILSQTDTDLDLNIKFEADQEELEFDSEEGNEELEFHEPNISVDFNYELNGKTLTMHPEISGELRAEDQIQFTAEWGDGERSTSFSAEDLIHNYIEAGSKIVQLFIEYISNEANILYNSEPKEVIVLADTNVQADSNKRDGSIGEPESVHAGRMAPPDKGSAGEARTEAEEVSAVENSCSGSYSMYFQPSQGAFQKDKNFDPKVTKYFAALNSPISYQALLNLATNRDIVLAGFDPSQAPSPANTGTISLDISSSFTETVKASPWVVVKNNGKVLREYKLNNESYQLPIGGAKCSRKAVRHPTIKIPVDLKNQINKKLRLKDAGSYSISLEFREGSKPVGISSQVNGEAVDILTPKVGMRVYWPKFAYSTSKRATREKELVSKAQAAAIIAGKEYPKYFPHDNRKNLDISFIKSTRAFGPRDLNWKKLSIKERRNTVYSLISKVKREAIVLGFDHYIIYIDPNIYDLIDSVFGLSSRAISSSNKRSMLFRVLDPDTVNHELHHVAGPEKDLWGNAQMKAECGEGYHAAKISDANGIDLLGFNYFFKARDVMAETLITKSRDVSNCTYRHGLKALTSKKKGLGKASKLKSSKLSLDSLGFKSNKKIMVSARVSRNQSEGSLYESELVDLKDGVLMIDPNLSNSKQASNEWAFRLRDSEGKDLGTYPFNVGFEISELEQPIEEDVAAHTLPYSREASSLELLSPQGLVLDKQELKL